jgi:hypothetical protein
MRWGTACAATPLSQRTDFIKFLYLDRTIPLRRQFCNVHSQVYLMPHA